MSLDYSKNICIYSIRNEFHDMICEIRDELDLKFEVESDTACFYLSMDDSLAFELSIPENFHIGELKEEHVEKINSLWPHRFEGSESFILFTIKYHLNVGLFDDKDNLVAWCLRYCNGALAILQTDSKYSRRGFGSLIVKYLSKKIADECKCDNIATIVHENEKSINLFSKLGFRKLGSHTWYNLTKK